MVTDQDDGTFDPSIKQQFYADSLSFTDFGADFVTCMQRLSFDEHEIYINPTTRSVCWLPGPEFLCMRCLIEDDANEEVDFAVSLTACRKCFNTTVDEVIGGDVLPSTITDIIKGYVEITKHQCHDCHQHLPEGWNHVHCARCRDAERNYNCNCNLLLKDIHPDHVSICNTEHCWEFMHHSCTAGSFELYTDMMYDDDDGNQEIHTSTANGKMHIYVSDAGEIPDMSSQFMVHRGDVTCLDCVVNKAERQYEYDVECSLGMNCYSYCDANCKGACMQ